MFDLGHPLTLRTISIITIVKQNHKHEMPLPFEESIYNVFGFDEYMQESP
jgi:hypothetical protein